MKKEPRVLLLIPHLGGGGAEKVTYLLARELGRKRYDLHLGLVAQRQAEGVIDAPATVHVIGASRVRSSAGRLLRLVWRTKPDLILSNMAHLNFLVLLLRPLFPKGMHVIVRQNGTASSMINSDRSPLRARWLYCALYRRAERIICQTDAMADDLERIAPVLKGKTTVLRNPVDLNAVRTTADGAPSKWTGAGPHLLSVGRLANEKGFDLLLEAMTKVKADFPNAAVTIAGTGPEKDTLVRLCHSLNLNRHVRFLGAVPAPAMYFRGATVFVSSSRHEAMSNALLEAAAAGLPIVSTPASEGMVQLLHGKEGVWLTKDTSADALATTLKQTLRTLQPGQRFPHPWIEEFHMDHAVTAYGQLIDETLDSAR
ncbi:MAG: glycosyltransferase [Acidobacteriota bacterium]|nr:glycosyltransferase [Acidobacteriota bacterium]